MRRVLSALAALLAMGSASPAAEATMDDVTRFAKNSNAFGLDLQRRLGAPGSNLVFSPASVTTALAMTWGGARGETAAEMKQALRFEGTPASMRQASARLTASLTQSAGSVLLRIANGLFGERSFTFQPAFLTATQEAFGAPLDRLDFKGTPDVAREAINNWVLAQTEKRIRDLVPPGAVKTDTRLVLVNAVYFLGDWQQPFEAEATRPAPFQVSSASTKHVPTMHRTDQLRFTARDGLKALELPYRESGLSMLLLLPDAALGLPALEESLTAENLDTIVQALAPTRVAVALPRFEVAPPDSLPLGAILTSMGMTLAFDRLRADFTGIANPPDPRDRLYVSEVFHKAFVKADEKGTEAAAATAVVMFRATSMPPPVQAEFKADHPFLFFIRDNPTGLVVFMGRVADPSSK